jgi:hypothetical protein
MEPRRDQHRCGEYLREQARPHREFLSVVDVAEHHEEEDGSGDDREQLGRAGTNTREMGDDDGGQSVRERRNGGHDGAEDQRKRHAEEHDEPAPRRASAPDGPCGLRGYPRSRCDGRSESRG